MNSTMRVRRFVVAATAVMLVGAGCGSSSRGSGSTSGPAGAKPSNKTYTIGVITDLTGPAAGNGQTLESGIQARIGLAAQEGYNFKYIIADTGSSPAGVLSAAQKLVDQDHVFAVVLASGIGFAAAPWLTSHGVPVIGAAVDSTEWQRSPNMFSVFPVSDPTKVLSSYGILFKRLGATNIATIGLSISPLSNEAAKAVALSAEAAGLKVGYLNANFPFGTTNVGPMVLAMKNAGVNGFIAALLPNTSFAAVQQARLQGVDLKVVLMASGYGGDLILGGKEAQSIAQGMYFYFSFEPVELHTPATQKFQNALSTYAHFTSEPTLDTYIGYVSVDALVTGLKAAGSNPTQQTLIKAMGGITNYGADGLLGSHPINWVVGQRVNTTDVCLWATQYTGSVFKPIPWASPLCSGVLAGKTVSGPG
jgi:ABC-type branched-subunit amino acid transport system substrate-binding protein